MSHAAIRPSAPSNVSFLYEAAAAPSKSSPVIEGLEDPNSILGEEFRLLVSRLRTDAKSAATRCLALTSALPEEGKSTMAVGLAAALARKEGRRVLLVEADLRRPTISEGLGLPPARGLSEWLSRKLEQVPVRQIGRGGFFALVAGQEPLKRPESLGSPLMDGLLRAARAAFDDVIVDVPPLLPVADTVLMQDLVDGFLFVVRSRMTPREAILDALGRLKPGKVLGVILNDHKEYRHSYSAYAYERYGLSARPRTGSRRRY